MDTKKLVYLGLAPVVVIFGPFILLSTSMMGCYQSQIDRNPNSDSSKTWQLRLAKIAHNTMRPDLGAQMYGRFADRYTEDPRRPDALFLQAECFLEAEMKNEAAAALQRLCRDHPDTPRGREADERLTKEYKIYTR